MVDLSASQTFDELDVRQKPELASFLGPDERILFSGPVMKINKHRAAQERILIITDKYLYNICLSGNILNNLQLFFSAKSALKRKIEMKKISEMTLSTHAKSQQFIIHVQDDYDYRYDPIGKRDKIVQAICTAFFETGKKMFTFYLKEVEDLASFHTTDDDFKAQIIKKPTTGKVMVSKQLFDRGLQYIIDNKNNFMMGDMPEHELLKAHSVMVTETTKEYTEMPDYSFAKMKTFENTKPIHSIEDIPMTSSGFVPRSAIQNHEMGGDPMLQPFKPKPKFG